MSQSAIAWFEDVDTSLVAEIKKSVLIPKKGALVELPDDNIIIRKPEEDYKIEVYPSVSIYNLSSDMDDKIYYTYARVDKEYDYENSTVSYRGENVPFKLQYQIDFWAKFQTDMNSMTQTWMASHFRQFNLDILSDEGFSCNCVQEGDLVKSDLLSAEERVFHSIITYSIWVEIEDKRVYTKPIVEGVHIEASEMK